VRASEGCKSGAISHSGADGGGDGGGGDVKMELLFGGALPSSISNVATAAAILVDAVVGL